MSGVLIAVVVFVLSLLGHLLFSHARRLSKPEPVLLSFMAAAALAYIIINLSGALTGFIGVSVVPPVADFVTGLAALGFLALGYLEFWSLVERSFSLRILIDLTSSGSALTADEIAGAYAEGRGLRWMMDKRMEDLVGSGMMAADGSLYRLTRRGRTVAVLFLLLHRVFRVT